MLQWIIADINNHGDLISAEQIVREINRLRQRRYDSFDRRWEHTFYTHYSARIGELSQLLRTLGVEPPKPQHRSHGSTKQPELPSKSLYQVYLGWYKSGQIDRDKFFYYTRKDGGVRPSPSEWDEYQEIVIADAEEAEELELTN